MKFEYNMFDGFMEDGKRIGIWEVLLYLNDLYEENQALKKEIENIEEEYYEYTLIMSD